MFQHPTVWFDRKQLKYLSKELLLYDFAQEVDWCMINCDKQRLQTSVSINLWKILAGHTGDWFDVKTASICTTELWDALKSFILTSLKFKVAPYPIIVSLDTLTSTHGKKLESFVFQNSHMENLGTLHFQEQCSWPKILVLRALYGEGLAKKSCKPCGKLHVGFIETESNFRGLPWTFSKWSRLAKE